MLFASDIAQVALVAEGEIIRLERPAIRQRLSLRGLMALSLSVALSLILAGAAAAYARLSLDAAELHQYHLDGITENSASTVKTIFPPIFSQLRCWPAPFCCC
jgi:hypothetical protein